jgi:hypothetical protein
MSAAGVRPKPLYIWNTKAALARNPAVFEHLSAVLQRAFAPDVEVLMLPPYDSLRVVVSESAYQTYGFFFDYRQSIQQILWEHGIFASESYRLPLTELCPNRLGQASKSHLQGKCERPQPNARAAPGGQRP